MSLVLHNGDCLDIMRDISDHSVDLILCDLPYGCLSSGSPERKRFINGQDTGTILSGQTVGGCRWDVKIDLTAFWVQAERILRTPASPVVHFCSTKFGAELIASNPLWFRYDLVWAKPNGVGFLSANKKPMAAHEMIYVFSKKGAYYKRIDSTEQRCVTSVITMSTKKRKGNHPTQKPVDLYRWLLERYCPAGGTVLDPTFGSGNSVFTARDMGLHAIGIEKDPVFFKKAHDKNEALL